MRSTGEPDWFEHRHCVPLTGREPVLGQLKTRLRVRGPGWGWTTLRGPAGSGVSRLLDEACWLLGKEGGPPPLRIRPVAASRLSLEPIRRAVAPLLEADTLLPLQRAIAAVLPVGPAQVQALAAWVLGAEGARRRAPIEPGLVSRLLLRLAAPGPVIVDDFQHLDEPTMAALAPLAGGEGPGVLAGFLGTPETEVPGVIFDLEPLSSAQLELLLKRWLRNAASARRLTALLAAPCQGWPGRVVQAVRRLALDGNLVKKEKRGVVLTKAPATWPDGLRRAGAFLEQARAKGAQAARVLEVAAASGGPDEVGILAEAAGVKPAYVRALIDEAVAARGGLEPGRFFPSPIVRRAFRDRLAPTRLEAAQARLQAPLERRLAGRAARRHHALMRVSLLAGRREPLGLESALAAALPLCRPLVHLTPRGLDVLAEGARILLLEAEGSTHLSAEIAHELWEVGRRAQAEDLLEGVVRRDPRADLLSRARLLPSSEALDLLEAELSASTVLSPVTAFPAWALLAGCRLEAGNPDAARAAWRHAATCLPAAHGEWRAAWHRGLAACAQTKGGLRLAGAHTVRAVRLLLASGCLRGAAEALLSLGEIEILRGRPPRALPALMHAARLFRQLGRLEDEARTRFRAGRVLTWMEAYDRSAESLQEALRAAERADLPGLLPRIHLALAHAQRGRGDLLRERHHAERAAEAAGTTLGRVQAAAVLARSDLQVGVPGAGRVLRRCEQDLRAAGFVEEAEESRQARLQGHLQAGEAEQAGDLLETGRSTAVEHLAAARLALSDGRNAEACEALETLGSDGSLPAGLRAAAYAHLADGLRLLGRGVEARARAVAAAALLEVRRRSRADDAGLHRVLARVFRDVGEHGRAVGHRAAARVLRRRDPRPSRRAG